MQKLNRTFAVIMVVLALLASVTVLIGFTQPPQTDEGTGAHIFQLTVLALFPTIAVFLGTTDWSRPMRSLRPLIFPTVLLLLAFAGVYRLDHYR